MATLSAHILKNTQRSADIEDGRGTEPCKLYRRSAVFPCVLGSGFQPRRLYLCVCVWDSPCQDSCCTCFHSGGRGGEMLAFQCYRIYSLSILQALIHSE